MWQWAIGSCSHQPPRHMEIHLCTLSLRATGEMSTLSVIFSSTSEVYEMLDLGSHYDNFNFHFLSCEKITGVRSCYDEGKRVAETLMFDYHRQHGIGNCSHLFLVQNLYIANFFLLFGHALWVVLCPHFRNPNCQNLQHLWATHEYWWRARC